MATPSCKFVWYELMTRDTDAAASFYQNVAGWEIKPFGLSEHAYSTISAAQIDIGGLMPIPDEAREAGAQPCWLGYIGVDDVDLYTQRVTEAGGSVLRAPADIPEVGRFSVVADPHGAVFMLFKSAGSPSPRPSITPGTPGHIGWHELHAGDGPSAFAFYVKLFGWSKADVVDMGPMGIYQLFAVDGEPVGGMMTKMEHIPRPFWLFYINVEAIDAALQRALDGGGSLISGPHEVPGGSWIVQCTDPQGAVFAMVAAQR